jgi:hypothetical protein
VPTLDDITSDLLTQGFAGFESDDDAVLEELAEALGRLVGTRLRRSELVPRASGSGTGISLSERAGFGAFEAHTDGANLRVPPRWSVMRLQPGARTDVSTHLWDVWALPLSPERVDILRRAMFTVRGGARPFYTSILREIGGVSIVRLNRTCMTPLTRAGAAAAEDLVMSLFSRRPIVHEWTPSSGLVFDNWRMIHARPAVDEDTASDRRLDRILVGGQP